MTKEAIDLHRKRVIKRTVRRILFWFILALILLFFMAPLIWLVSTSFKNYIDAFAMPPKIIFTPTLENYITVFNKANFFKGFKFTYKYALQYIEKQPNIQWKNEDHDLIIENALKQIHEWNQERDVEQAEGEIYGLLCDELNSYYYMELLSAEETADKLQNKMTIFLQE